jgi:type I restriction enzyme S subunit
MQDLFAHIVMKIEEQKALSQQSLQKSEELFQSLLQRAFSGNLI